MQQQRKQRHTPQHQGAPCVQRQTAPHTKLIRRPGQPHHTQAKTDKQSWVSKRRRKTQAKNQRNKQTRGGDIFWGIRVDAPSAVVIHDADRATPTCSNNANSKTNTQHQGAPCVARQHTHTHGPSEAVVLRHDKSGTYFHKAWCGTDLFVRTRQMPS